MSSRGSSRVVLTSLTAVATFSLAVVLGGPARAQESGQYAAPPDDAQYYPEAEPAGAPAPYQGQPGWNTPPDAGDESNGGAPLIPPNVEGPAYPTSDGTYCYVGPHPVDTRVVPGEAWDNTPGQHLRPYPPIDTRLFSYRDGCYYFTGDPRDFGYGGQTYAYYGAHPILDGYGGGWCFMMGPHTHVWAPWSPSFTVVGSWYYWHGPYDPFFWAYWPYYSLYYRSYYPSYYGGGRFYRGGGGRVAPSIRPVQVQAWRGNNLRGAPVYRGSPPGATVRGVAPGNNAYRAAPAPGSRMGNPPAAGPFPGPGFHPAQPGFQSAPPGSHPAQPGFHPGPPAGQPAPAFRSPAPGASRPSFTPAPAPRSFSPPGGGFHGGGGGGFRRR